MQLYVYKCLKVLYLYQSYYTLIKYCTTLYYGTAYSDSVIGNKLNNSVHIQEYLSLALLCTTYCMVRQCVRDDKPRAVCERTIR